MFSCETIRCLISSVSTHIAQTTLNEPTHRLLLSLEEGCQSSKMIDTLLVPLYLGRVNQLCAVRLSNTKIQ
jgi:hypothetical protein